MKYEPPHPLDVRETLSGSPGLDASHAVGALARRLRALDPAHPATLAVVAILGAIEEVTTDARAASEAQHLHTLAGSLRHLADETHVRPDTRRALVDAARAIDRTASAISRTTSHHVETSLSTTNNGRNNQQ